MTGVDQSRVDAGLSGSLDIGIRQHHIRIAATEFENTFLQSRSSLSRDRFSGLEVDLFASEPLDFDAAYGRAVRVQLSSTFATVVALEDLVALKKAAGRPVDLADIEALRALAEEEG